MHDSIVDLLQGLLKKHKMSADEVGALIGKPGNTLRRELNPYDDYAKFGVETLIPYMRALNDYSPLEFIAAHSGFRIVPISDVQPNNGSLAEELCDDLPAISEYQQSILNGESLLVVGEKLRKATDELEQNFVLYRDELARKSKA